MTSFLQKSLFISRWLVAPFLVGLLLSVFLLMYRFFRDLVELASQAPTGNWHELITGVLYLVSIALTANLILVVVFSGYVNFIRKIDAASRDQWPEGLVQVDIGAVRQKLIGSVVAIASIDALAWYFDLPDVSDTTKLGWVLAFPLMLAAVVLLLAIADWLSRPGKDA